MTNRAVGQAQLPMLVRALVVPSFVVDAAAGQSSSEKAPGKRHTRPGADWFCRVKALVRAQFQGLRHDCGLMVPKTASKANGNCDQSRANDQHAHVCLPSFLLHHSS